MRYIETFKILALERGKNSYYGNPSWLNAVEGNTNGFRRIAKTSPNIALSYAIGYGNIGSIFEFSYSFNKKGDMIIHSGKEVNIIC